MSLHCQYVNYDPVKHNDSLTRGRTVLVLSMRAIVVARPWVLISVVFYGSAPFSVRAASLCDSLVEDLRKTSCIDLKSTGSNPIDGFKLRR